jgi:CHAT domain-containing protein
MEHPVVAEVLNSLAKLCLMQREYPQAEELLKRALTIAEKTLGPEHPAVAEEVNNLGVLYLLQSKYSQAEPFCKRCLAITEKTHGPNHPQMAASLNNLGAVCFGQGQSSLAEELINRALAIRAESLAPKHPDVAQGLNNLAQLRSAMGRDKEALELRMRANTIIEGLVTKVFSFSSEKERFQFLYTLEGDRSAFLTLCGERLGADGADAGLSFLLRRKGIVLDSLVEDAEVARLSGDPALTALVTQLRETKTRLAKLALAGPGKERPEDYQATMQQVQAQAEECEKELARQSVRFRALRPEHQATLADVAAALPPDGALVEFAKYTSLDITAKRTVPQWGTGKYIAYVLQHGGSKPVLVKLGEADSIERLVKNYQAAMQGFAQKRANVTDLNAASEALAAAVWAPVKTALGTAKRVCLSPDGELNFVSFAGLRDKSGRYVLEDYDLAYVASGRDLVRAKLAGDKTPKGPVLFGAPDFGDKAVEPKGEKATRAGNVRSDLVAVRAFAGLQFGPLPGTKTEVKGIKKLASSHGLKPETYLGRDASEGQVKAAEQPRILHLATHGFFLPESGWSTPTGDDDTMARGMKMMGMGNEPVDLGKWKLGNPMHRSGLALAGANLALAGKADAGQEDGILTAEEVAGLDLAGTELVVLSACETGLGEAKGGEGVLGLRRAFVQAGAQNLVMALWSVSDDATQELMKAMYAKYLSGQPVWKALLDAQRDALAKERQAGREPNPFLWAAFVASGVGVQ